MACHQNRVITAMRELCRTVENGRFGRLSHGSVNLCGNRDHSYYDQAKWRGTRKDDGGWLMNQRIRGAGLPRRIMGDRVVAVYGATRRQFPDYARMLAWRC